MRLLTLPLRPALFVISTALVACSGSSSNTDGGNPADGGSPADGGGGNCHPTQIDGTTFFSRVVTYATPSDIATATFPSTPGLGVANFLSCSPGCSYVARGDGGVVDAGYLNVGSLTASNVTQSTNVSFTATNLGSGPLYIASGLTWSAGDTLRVTGGGSGGFPNFTVNVSAPSAGPPSSPVELQDAGLVTASRGAGLTVTWTPASPAATFVAVTIDTPTGGINCYVPDSAGTLTIPSATLSNIPTGTYPLPTGIVFGRWNAGIDSSSGKNISYGAAQYQGAALQLNP